MPGADVGLRPEDPTLATALKNGTTCHVHLDGNNQLPRLTGENDFTNRDTSFMTWNLLHLARIMKAVGGMPAHGNQRSAWDAGCRSDFPNPEHR